MTKPKNPWEALSDRIRKLPIQTQAEEILPVALAYLDTVWTHHHRSQECIDAALDRLTRRVTDLEESLPKRPKGRKGRVS